MSAVEELPMFLTDADTQIDAHNPDVAGPDQSCADVESEDGEATQRAANEERRT